MFSRPWCSRRGLKQLTTSQGQKGYQIQCDRSLTPSMVSTLHEHSARSLAGLGPLSRGLTIRYEHSRTRAMLDHRRLGHSSTISCEHPSHQIDVDDDYGYQRQMRLYDRRSQLSQGKPIEYLISRSLTKYQFRSVPRRETYEIAEMCRPATT